MEHNYATVTLWVHGVSLQLRRVIRWEVFVKAESKVVGDKSGESIESSVGLIEK